MKYLMMVCTDPAAEAEAVEENVAFEPVEPWVQEMDRRGVRLIGDRVRPQSDWTTVKVRKGDVLIADGPYVETKDLIAGFDVLECDNLDEAIAVAAKHPMAKVGVLELRPFWPFDS